VTARILLLFFSGLAALVYQVIWIKQLTLVVGVDVFAVTTGVSGFFAGLAMGSALFGRLADRTRSPLRLYAVLEVGIAVLGVAATLALAATPALFVALQSSVGWLAWVLPFALIAAPATLMGGTLPPLLASIHPGEKAIGRASGQLYAANTAGAIAGALLTAFAFVPTLGLRGASTLAATLNLVLAIAAWRLVPTSASTSTKSSASEPVEATASPEAFLALWLYALAGGIALGYEVVWTQVIVQFLSTRAIAFSVVLATYLAGLVIGSWVYARIADRVQRPWTVFGLLIAGAGVAALATFAGLGPWLLSAQEALGKAVFDLTDSRMAQMCARFALATGVVVLPPTLLLGAAFPAAARLAVAPQRVGTDVGTVLALNTALGIAGTMATGFVLVPLFGLARSLAALALAAAVLGGIALARQSGFTRASLVRSAALVAAVALLAVALPRDRLATLLTHARGGELRFYDESPAGTVAVIEQSAPSGKFRRLYIQGVSNTGDAMPSLRYMRLQALTPLLVHPGEPRSVLVIGLGTGITGGALLTYPWLDRRLCIELLAPVVEAAPRFAGNFGAGVDPLLEVRVADGRHELMRSEESFDVITLEPPPPAAAGAVNLYSKEFYELANERLNEDGLLAQWWPIATQNDEDSQSLVRSMLDVFPYVTLWTTEFHEMMLIGSREPQRPDFERVAERMRAPSVAQALREVGVETPADLLATYLTDRSGLEAYAGDAQPVTDDRPRIEYASWIRAQEITRVLPKLLELRQPPPVATTSEQAAAVEASYRQLIAFYDLSLVALGGDRETWAARAQEFASQPTSNAYYDWFFGR
jgi:predicted membrane-bound spermidine synthase